MKLRIQAGELTGNIVDLPATGLVIGRDPHCELVLDQDGVSRQHARIVLEHGVYVIEDLGSTNGVRVNGQRISGSKPLLNGDKIGISTNVLLLTDEEHIADEDKLNTVVPPRTPGEVRAADTGRAAADAINPATLAGMVLAVMLFVAVVGGLIWLLADGGDTRAQSPPTTTVADDVIQPEPEPVQMPPGPPARQENPPAEVEQPDQLQRMLYYQIQSEPPGAEVLVDGEVAGHTPVVLTDLRKGSYEFTLAKPGYEPMSRFFYVPVEEPPPVYELRQKKGTCELTSEPEGAAVFHGKQLIGTTPLLIDVLPPGTHTVHVTAPGHAATEVELRLADYRAAEKHVTLVREVGELHVTTFPAGGQVVVDGFPMGASQPLGPQAYESTEMKIGGLSAGTHSVYLLYHGVRSQPQTITIDQNEAVRVRLAIWLPNATLHLISNREFTGMLRREYPNGDVEMAVSPTRMIRVKADKIRGVDVIPIETFLQNYQPGQDRR